MCIQVTFIYAINITVSFQSRLIPPKDLSEEEVRNLRRPLEGICLIKPELIAHPLMVNKEIYSSVTRFGWFYDQIWGIC